MSNSFILEQHSSYVIAQLSSPIRFSLGSLSLYTGLLALNVALRRLYLCLCLTLGPSLIPLNACMCRGCPTLVWKDLAPKSLSDFIAPSPTDDLCNANRYLPWLWNLLLTDHVIALSTQSLVSAMALSLESHLFCLQPFQVSGCLSVLIL